jgi:hypothetical protein
LNEIIAPLTHNAASQVQMSRAKKKAFPKIQSLDELESRAELRKFTFTIRGASAAERTSRYEELFYRGSGTF